MQKPMFDSLPIDNPETERKMLNCLQEMMLELMEKKGCSLADIQRETSIPWGTLYAWYIGDVRSQLLEHNVLVLAKYFGVPLEYLAFGIGDSEPPPQS